MKKRLQELLSALFTLGVLWAIYDWQYGGSGYGWLAKKDGVTVCLIPVTHIARERPGRLKRSIQRCITDATVFAIETKTPASEAESNNKIIALKAYQKTLSDLPHSLDNDWKRVAEVLRKRFPNEKLPNTIDGKSGTLLLEILLPIYLRLLGYDYEKSIEGQLLLAATSEGSKIVALETWADQYRTLSEFATTTSNRALAEFALKVENNDIERYIDGLNYSWKIGDFSKASEIIEYNSQKYTTEALAIQMIATPRNRAMVARIDQIVDQSGTLAVALGILHFLGDDSVLVELKRLGYSIEKL